MCQVYNQIGSLTTIRSHLSANNIYDYNSIKELINFQKSYSDTHARIKSDHQILIEKEKETLYDEILQLEQSIDVTKSEVEQALLTELNNLNDQLNSLILTDTNLIRKTLGYFKKTRLKLNISNKKNAFDSIVEDSIRNLTERLCVKKNRHQYILSNSKKAVEESCLSQLHELDRKKRVIEAINNDIYGALGEQQVVKELEKLSDEYILINNFHHKFYPPIYNKNENDHIHTIQVDHVLIAPSGIFLIETKNWSKKSLDNLNLYSPVQQIIRQNFAFYRLLKGADYNIRLNKTHWGERKIPVRNLIVFINHAPIEEFQHVKIVTLKELNSYIKYFKPSFSIAETNTMVNYLLNI